MGSAIVLLSGGMDSCVAAAAAACVADPLYALHADYGQRTMAREASAAAAIARHYDIADERCKTISLAWLGEIGGSSLTDPTIPVRDADLNDPAMPASYVPFRNTHLLSAAVSWAEVVGAQTVWIGAVAEDSSGYPDCRPEYYRAFNELVRVGTASGSPRTETPLISMSKADIVREGLRLGAPLHLTWSCYRSSDIACGRCDSCALRLRGFQEAGVDDPIPYAERPDYA